MSRAAHDARRLILGPAVTCLLCALWTPVGLAFFLEPSSVQRTAVGHATSLSAAWYAGYLLAALIFTAAWRAREPATRVGLEEGALILLTGSLTTNGLVSLSVNGPLDLRSHVYTIAVAFAVGRLRAIRGA